MSIQPGAYIQKDPQAEIVYTFNWAAWLDGSEIDSYTITISGPDSVLEQDNDSVDAGNENVSVRLKGGTVGKQYTVTCRIVTDEAVPQTDDRSITVQIRNQ